MFKWRVSDDYDLLGRPSSMGLVVGALFLAVSLTPSMIPREGMVQGGLAGLCFAAGYGLGWLVVAIWDWLHETPHSPAHSLKREGSQNQRLVLALLLAFGFVAWGLWNATSWQNGIRAAMDMPPVESARPFTILFVAFGVSLVLVLVGRLFRRLTWIVRAQLEPYVPSRVALFAGLVAAGMLFWSVGNDVVLGRALAFMDETYARLDDLMPTDEARPQDPMKTGSAQSLLSWDHLGAEGRGWILSEPDLAALQAAGAEAPVEPIRVYVGMNSAQTAEARAALALDEAIRVGAFERKYLIIATPTGTGWMDPAGLQPLEHLTEGDVATIAMQYSYLPSWLSLMVQPDYGSDSARALFRVIHGHWMSLPVADRPELYIFGLSLGARNSEVSASLPQLVAGPPQGALLVGPPFASIYWTQALQARRPDSPAWAPIIGDGSMVRVTTQTNRLEEAAAPWGPMRVVYLEYPSDPIVFFSPRVMWSAPDWLDSPRADDLSQDLRWYPVVTFLQLLFDMMTATTAPMGYGHVYAPEHYLGAWGGVMGIQIDEARKAAILAQIGRLGGAQ